MGIYIRVPSSWQRAVDGKDVLEAKGSTVREVLQFLSEAYPGLKETILDREGEVRQFIIYVNDKDMRCIQNLETPVDTGDSVSIVLSITPLFAGG